MMGIEQLRPQAVVDDIIMFATSPGRVIQEADGLLKHGVSRTLVINANSHCCTTVWAGTACGVCQGCIKLEGTWWKPGATESTWSSEEEM